MNKYVVRSSDGWVVKSTAKNCNEADRKALQMKSFVRDWVESKYRESMAESNG